MIQSVCFEVAKEEQATCPFRYSVGKLPILSACHDVDCMLGSSKVSSI